MTQRQKLWWLVTLLVALWLLSMTMRSQEAASTYLEPITAPARARGISVHFLISILGNVAVFVPLGASAALALAGRSRPARLLRATLVGAGLSAAIELLQLAVPGRFSTWDDWLLNTLGAALGAGAVVAFDYLRERRSPPPAD